MSICCMGDWRRASYWGETRALELDIESVPLDNRELIGGGKSLSKCGSEIAVELYSRDLGTGFQEQLSESTLAGTDLDNVVFGREVECCDNPFDDTAVAEEVLAE